MLLGGLFVVAGIRHLSMLPRLSTVLRTRGVPRPRLCLAVGTAFQIAAGGLLMFGLLVPPAAFALVVFTIVASVTMMNFWDLQGEMREAAIRGWQSNLAIIGGLLIAAAQAI
jgi:putative oxidoreductase